MWQAGCAVALMGLIPSALSFSLAGLATRSTKAEGAATRRFFSLPLAVNPEAGDTMQQLLGGDSPVGNGGSSGGPAAELVTQILGKIDGTDRGLMCTPEERQSIDGMIEQLNNIDEGKDWLADPLLFGNYNVAYVSSGSSEKSNPAGGRWRGRVGRTLFRTEEMFQHLVAPATAVNMVVFRVFGLLSGCVTLRGDFEAVPERPNFVKAAFGPPIINFLGRYGVTMRFGPKSSVALAATYVDDRVRIGKGGRGSLFVFTRGGPAATPAADMWKVYANTKMKSRTLSAVVACGAIVAAARSALVPAGVLGIVSTALFFARGGIERDQGPDFVEPPPS